jgi:YD repeat-containing protein
LLSETTPQGAISYTYDELGRRSAMTVPGQTAVNYSYDAANRLTQIVFIYHHGPQIITHSQPVLGLRLVMPIK